jgi:hypothetical protein
LERKSREISASDLDLSPLFPPHHISGLWGKSFSLQTRNISSSLSTHHVIDITASLHSLFSLEYQEERRQFNDGG